MPAQFKMARFRKAAFGAVLAAGCLAAPGFVHARTVSDGDRGGQDKLSKKAAKQVAAAERAVTKAPSDAVARARLGQTYLAAGRFVSAGTSFEDAVSLGDKTPSTALGMALSYIAAGRNAEATALLGQWGDAIPVSDHGLALALAGQPAEAITLLGDAIKQGENTPKIRQNLAYAYALAGHLPEARMIAAQDVPADKLETRVSEWALAASVGTQQSRVAALLGAPVRDDAGLPVALALAPSAGRPALAAAEPVAPPAELPALVGGAPAMAHVEPLAAPEPIAASPQPAAFAAAEAAPAPEVADIAEVMRRYEARKPAQDVAPAKARPSALAAVRARQERKLASAKPAASAPAGTHVVQLGSFTTEAGAHRAWNIFVSRDASLKGRELRITQATVNGRRYFRVAAAGYQAAEARSKCSSLKGRGNACLAVADRSAPHGSVPAKALAPMLARR
jgi:tetratricopeptide (TPR) repeat protein